MAIAIFKLCKGFVLLALTVGTLHLLQKDVEATVYHWINTWRIDPDNRYIAMILHKLEIIRTSDLKKLTYLTGVYAALFLTEGVGLALSKRWAEWLTIWATGFFIPLEAYGLCQRPTALKAGLLLINAVVVVFLIYVVRKKESSE